MNKKRKADDVLESIFNLIQDAHNELNKFEKNDQNHNLLIEKENSKNINKNLIREKLVDNSDKKDGNWSNLTFDRIDFTKDKNITHSNESKNIKSEFSFSEDYIEEVFLDSLKNWRKKNLKNLTENIYQEIIKESLKNKLK